MPHVYQKWSLKIAFFFSVYDASSKFPTGILAGNSFDFGNFDECLGTVTTGLDFEPQLLYYKRSFFTYSEIISKLLQHYTF